MINDQCLTKEVLPRIRIVRADA